MHRSLVLFSARSREAAGNMKAQLVSALDDLLSFHGADVVRDLHRVLSGAHQQHLQVGWTLHQELVEAIFQAVARCDEGCRASNMSKNCDGRCIVLQT